MGIETLVAAGAGLLGASMQADAVGNAADSQAASSAAGIAEQRRQFDLTRGDFAPYRETGVRALGSLESDINKGPTAADVMSDPGYQFGLQQGQQAIDRKAAAAGGRISGASLKRASGFATDYATSGYNAAYQRRQDRLNRLAALAGIGQTATGSSAAAGGQSSNAISGLLERQGDSTAAAGLARGNIWGNAVNQLGAIGSRWARGSGGTVPGVSGTYDPGGDGGYGDFYYGGG
jgi:hypothetical protein